MPQDITPTDTRQQQPRPQSIYPTTREPQRPCESCGAPYGLHRGSCPTLECEQEGER